MFVVYGLGGLIVFWLYRRLLVRSESQPPEAVAPLGPSGAVVVRLAAVFSVNAFVGLGGQFAAVAVAVRALRSVAGTGRSLLLLAGLLSAVSQFAAPAVAARIGLLNTMVLTHIPANICLIVAAWAPSLPIALGLLFVRSALSQIDVPTRWRW